MNRGAERILSPTNSAAASASAMLETAGDASIDKALV
jgi:hypothetical protein